MSYKPSSDSVDVEFNEIQVFNTFGGDSFKFIISKGNVCVIRVFSTVGVFSTVRGFHRSTVEMFSTVKGYYM